MFGSKKRKAKQEAEFAAKIAAIVTETIATKNSANENTTTFKEAAGAMAGSIDADDHLYSKLSADSNRNLSGPTRVRMNKIAPYLWQSNMIANRIIELPLAYLLAEGVKITNDDEDYQAVIDAFWNHPINNMAIKLEKKVRELAIFGEQFYPAFVNPLSGEVQLSYLDPAHVEEVIYDPRNPEQPVGVKTKRMSNGRHYFYKVIINGSESVFTKQTQRLREGFADGDIFYFAINSFCAHGRGNSDLTAQCDFLDLYDDFIFGEGDRAENSRAFVWDVTLTGADKNKVTERASEIESNPPRPGSVNVHNDSEVWKAESPSLGTGDTEALAKLFRNHMLGGATMPPSWFADGGDVNRANGEAMAEPTFKILAMRQRYIIYMLHEIATFVIRQYYKATLGQEPDRTIEADVFKSKVVMPEMTAKDISRYAAALQQVVVAVNLAITQGIITEETGLSVIASIADRLGVEIDPATELENVKTEIAQKAKDQAKADTFNAFDGADDESADEAANETTADKELTDDAK
ncbi:hypothetical protein FQP85_08385 [Pseudoalteromonas neustonica]|uniref:Phage portal protein n=1 Tax=Pseudoalteromonas neustonica TaxID=1840331 RepID=A0ABY3FEB0_9GAMM|nr:hypothetical protein [Pseudoalteromonas neustonica]TVU83783.1 hypothetical protein FQP85_08385 [Pseudoalteromonas neustonica]